MAKDNVSEGMRTKRRTPTPANITFAGENTWEQKMRPILDNSWLEVYQANTLSKSLGEGIKNIHSGIKPLCPSGIVTLRLIQRLYLQLEDGENCAGRVASLELCSEWVGKKVLLCAFLVFF